MSLISQQSRYLEERNAHNLQDEFKFLNCKVKLWGSKNIIHNGVKTKLLTRKK